MKSKFYLSIILLSLLFSVCEKANAQVPGFEWVKGFGGVAWDACNSIDFDKAGNVYATGSFTGTVDFDPGPGIFNLTSTGANSVYVSKLDSLGNFVWAKAMGGTGSAGSNPIKIDMNGNIYIAGMFSDTIDFDPDSGVYNLTTPWTGDRDIFISKLDSSGKLIWVKKFGDTNDSWTNSMAIDNSGNVYTTGSFTSTVDFNPGIGTFNLTAFGTISFPDIFISKLDSLGNFVWAKQIGGTGPDAGQSIALDASGNVYTTGSFAGTADFDPDSSGVNNYSASSLANIFISKLDSSGSFVWAKQMAGNGTSGGYKLTLDDSGNIYTTGSFGGTVDFDPDSTGLFNLTATSNGDIFISKLDNSGNFVWAKRMSGAVGSQNRGRSIVLDSIGNIYTSGTFQGTCDFDPGPGVFNLSSAGGDDIYITKFDNSGNFVWTQAVGGTTNDNFNSVALDASDNVYVAGGFESPSISFGSTILINADSSGNNADMFIAKLNNVPTGIENINLNNNISIYPNPVHDVLNVSLNKALPANAIITINDMQGRVVGEKNTNHTYGSNSSVIPINVSALSQGVYLLRMDGVVRRFVKL